ncbi:MAG: helix-turn-helix domain-containing protein [Gemmatimonadaceae bacterium]
MIIRTPRDLGHLIRDRRRQAALTQERLATQIGVSRKWIIDIERGKRTAELTLVLRTLKALGIELDARPRPEHRSEADVDVNAIIAAARRRR